MDNENTAFVGTGSTGIAAAEFEIARLRKNNADMRARIDDYELITKRPAVMDVLCERAKQREKYSDSYDDTEHDTDDLAMVAAHLLHPDGVDVVPTWGEALGYERKEDRRSELVIAVALGLAEIERLDRAKAGS